MTEGKSASQGSGNCSCVMAWPDSPGCWGAPAEGPCIPGAWRSSPEELPAPVGHWGLCPCSCCPQTTGIAPLGTDWAGAWSWACLWLLGELWWRSSLQPAHVAVWTDFSWFTWMLPSRIRLLEQFVVKWAPPWDMLPLKYNAHLYLQMTCSLLPLQCVLNF